MFSIIGGRIRCEMGKSGYECYRQSRLAQLVYIHIRVDRSATSGGGSVFQLEWSVFSKQSGRPSTLGREGRQQMGEIGNQEQTIGDSGDDWRRRSRRL